MADNERISKTVLAYVVDQASVASVQRSTQSILKEFRALEGGVQAASNTTKNLTAGLKELERASSVDKLTRQFVDVGKSAKDFDGALISLRAGLKDVGASSTEIDKATQAFKEMQAAAQGAAEDAGAASGGSGGGFNLSSLRGVGRAANQLGLGAIGHPLQQVGDLDLIAKSASAAIAETGVSMTSLIAVAGPLALGVGGVALEFKQLTDIIEAGRKEVERAENALVDYFQVSATGTTKDIQQKIGDQRVIQNANESTLAINQKKINDLVGSQGLSPEMTKTITDEITKAIRTPNSPLTNTDLNLPVTLLPGIHSLIEESAKLATASKDAGDKIDKYTTALGSNSVKANDAAQEFLDFQKLTRGSSDAVKSRVQDLKDEQGALKIQIAYLQASGDTSEATSQKLRDLTAQYDADGKAIDNLNKNILPLTQAREKEAQDLKDVKSAWEEAQAANKKYADDVKTVHEKEGESELAIKQKYADKVADVIQKALDANSAALDKLNQKQADLRLNAGRDDDKSARKAQEDDLNMQIKERRQERDDLLSHLKKIRDIQRQFQSGERDALLDRNFLSLFKLQEQKKEQTSAENEAYEEQKHQRAQQYADEIQDAIRARAFESNERHIALQQRLNDAYTAYNIELNQAASAKRRGLEIAAQNERAELALAQQSATAQLKLIEQTEEAKLQIFRAVMARIYGSGDTITSGEAGFHHLQYFANGGTFGPGTVGVYNDGYPGQRESINGVKAPPGIGLFVSSVSGSVKDSGAHIGSLSMPIHIHESHNPQATYRIAKQAVVDGIKQVIRK